MVPKPMLATPATALPEGRDWSYERKWDGDRTLVECRDGRVQLYSKELNDVTAKYPTIVAALNRLSVGSLVLDGEIVAFDPKSGQLSFEALRSPKSWGAEIAFVAFDALEVNGRHLMRESLEERRAALTALPLQWPLLHSDPVGKTAAAATRQVKAEGVEGVIAKRNDSLYEPGRRSAAWVKVRFARRQEFVVGGFDPTGRTFDSIVVGYFTDAGELLAAGRVRAGFTPYVREHLIKKLVALETPECPFGNLPIVEKGAGEKASQRTTWGGCDGSGLA